MKPLTTYNRAAGYLNRIYDMLNAEFYNSQLIRPIVTIQSSPKTYGHISIHPIWENKNGFYRELNVSAGTLNRDIELVCTTILHEQAHQYNLEILKKQDCSRSGLYHSKVFKKTAEEHGLVVEKHSTYGYCITKPSDRLLEWLLTTDLVSIDIHRNEYSGIRIPGSGTHDGSSIDLGGTVRKQSSRKYQCGKCGCSVRATKSVRILCLDCQEPMELVTL